MPIDPQIALSVKPAQFQNPLEAYGQALQLKHIIAQGPLMAEQLKAAQLENQQRQQGITDDQNARQLFSQNPNPTPQDIYKAMGPRAGAAYLKSQQDALSAKYKTETERLTNIAKRNELIGSIAGTITDEASLYRGVGDALAHGLFTREDAMALVSKGWNPETEKVIRGYQQQALTAKQQAEEARAKAEADFQASMRPLTLKKAEGDATVAAVKAAQYSRQGMTDQERRQLEETAFRDTQNMLNQNEERKQADRRLQIEQGNLNVARANSARQQKQFDATYGAMLSADGKPLDPEAAKAVAMQDPTAVAIAHYQLDPPSMARGGQAASIMRKVMAINPGYRASDWQAQKATEVDYSPKGKSGQALTSTDTALAHLNRISEAGKALKNGDIQVLNRIANEIGAQTGSSPRMVYDAIVEMVGPEVSKAVIGGAGGEEDRRKMKENFKSSTNDATREAVIGGAAKLLGERYQKSAHAYEVQMGRPLPENRLSDASKAMLQRYGGNGGGGQQAAAPKNPYR